MTMADPLESMGREQLLAALRQALTERDGAQAQVREMLDKTPAVWAMAEVKSNAYRQGWNEAIDAALADEPEAHMRQETFFANVWRKRIAALRRPQAGTAREETTP